MSSFVLFTQHGPPDLIVEVGKPISSDPVLLSGLFKAIMSFTDEFAQAPLQVLQTKGFTVQFKQMFDDYVLIVGTDHTILGLDVILNQIEDIVNHGFKNNHDTPKIEEAIREVLFNYVEYGSTGNMTDGDTTIPEILISMIDDIPKITHKILLYGLLAGYRIKYPKTLSMDLNRNIVKFIEFLDLSCSSDLETGGEDQLEITGKTDSFLLMGETYKAKDVIKETKLLKELLQMIEEHQFAEFKLKVLSEIGTLMQLERVFLNFNPDDHSPVDQEEIDQFRYLIGHELEHYLLLRLIRKNQDLVKYLQQNINHTEWLSSW